RAKLITHRSEHFQNAWRTGALGDLAVFSRLGPDQIYSSTSHAQGAAVSSGTGVPDSAAQRWLAAKKYSGTPLEHPPAAPFLKSRPHGGGCQLGRTISKSPSGPETMARLALRQNKPVSTTPGIAFSC